MFSRQGLPQRWGRVSTPSIAGIPPGSGHLKWSLPGLVFGDLGGAPTPTPIHCLGPGGDPIYVYNTSQLECHAKRILNGTHLSSTTGWFRAIGRGIHPLFAGCPPGVEYIVNGFFSWPVLGTGGVPTPQVLMTGSGSGPHFKQHPWSCQGPDGMTKELIGALIRLSMKDGYSDVWSSLPQRLYRARRSLAEEGVHKRPDGLYDSNLSITSITITYIGHGLKQIQIFYCFVYKKVHRN